MTSILQKKNKKKINLEKTTFKLNETKRKGQYKMGTNVYKFLDVYNIICRPGLMLFDLIVFEVILLRVLVCMSIDFFISRQINNIKDVTINTASCCHLTFRVQLWSKHKTY
jgi:hypothetical protein